MARAGCKENSKTGSCKWRRVRPNRNLDFNFNALGGHWEKAQCIAVESVDSGVEILSLPHSSCVALDELLNLSAEFPIQ